MWKAIECTGLAAALLMLFAAAGCEREQPPQPIPAPETEMSLVSYNFQNGERIPPEHTCDGRDASPPLRWQGAPAGTAAFALVLGDPDAPGGTFTHWLVANIPVKRANLPGELPTDGTLEEPVALLQGTNDFGRTGYGGPCPPAAEIHRYFFRLYALDASLELSAGFTEEQLRQAMSGHKLAEAELMGRYARK